ncbi:MAG: SDR family oxidoreductase [Methylococcaceae bacterium]
MTHPPSDALIIGYGDIGRRVAELELAEGRSVAALVRSPAKWADHPPPVPLLIAGDLDISARISPLPEPPSVLYWFAPPPSSGENDPRISRFLTNLTPGQRPGKVVYISTSGVYGDCQGAWVTENQPLAPRTDRARRRWAAEQCLTEWASQTGVAYVILRVPGIYGPGRLPVERLQHGLPVITPEEAPYSNRIHADDLASICVAAARYSGDLTVFNVSDGHPTTMTDYFMQVAAVLKLQSPPVISMEEARTRFSASLLSFVEESRRMDNRLMREVLGIRLRYPNLALGLPASLP